jgi:formate/nitrite transporter FocA (FNT family)
MSYLSNALVDSGAQELTIKVAEKKALNEMYAIFIKGIGANFMVCVAVWQGTCAEEVAGKILALWFPTASFVMLGFDHVVANMYLLPIGMMLGANITVGRMFAALFMATLGNIIGGGIFVGAVYWYVFDSMSAASIDGLATRVRESVKRLSFINKGLSATKEEEVNDEMSMP